MEGSWVLRSGVKSGRGPGSLGPGKRVEETKVLRSEVRDGGYLGPQVEGWGWRHPGSSGLGERVEGSGVLGFGVGGGGVHTPQV